MKTTVVPAQITTVEDKIAGSLTFPQIILLVMSLVIGAAIYGGVAPKLHLGSVKLSLIITQFILFGGLALQFNGKILGDWLIIYLRYAARPRRYIFTKNDLTHRDIVIEKQEITIAPRKEKIERKSVKPQSLSLTEQIKIDQIFGNEDLSISFKMSKKGGLDVCLKQTKN